MLDANYKLAFLRLSILSGSDEMLSKRTVFVIGAGAGHELGMPLGSNLSDAIANDVNFYYDASGITKGEPRIDAALRKIARTQQLEMKELISAGRMISGGIRHTRSIDNYIYIHSDKEPVKLVAKTAIVHAIIRAEKNSHLYIEQPHSRSPQFRGDAEVHGSWLSSFFNLLTSDVPEVELDKLLDNLAIINFNYDRCIEHYLFHAMQELYPSKGAYIADLLNRKLEITHPYGVIGRLPWQTGNSVEFGGDLSDEQLAVLSGEIHTYNEQVEDAENLSKIRNYLDAAACIVFLGFHFHKQNMDLLTKCGPFTSSSTKVIYATQVDRSGADITRVDQLIRAMLSGCLIQPDSEYKGGQNCKVFFKNYSIAMSL